MIKWEKRGPNNIPIRLPLEKKTPERLPIYMYSVQPVKMLEFECDLIIMPFLYFLVNNLMLPYTIWPFNKEFMLKWEGKIYKNSFSGK